MKRVALDFETLALSPDAELLSVGWAVWWDDGEPTVGQVPLCAQGKEVDRSTVEWWMRQGSACFKRATEADGFYKHFPQGSLQRPSSTCTVADIRQLLNIMVDGADEVWTWGEMDALWLRGLIGHGWYRRWRDARTAASLFGLERPHNDEPHVPMSDALAVCRVVKEALRRVAASKEV